MLVTPILEFGSMFSFILKTDFGVVFSPRNAFDFVPLWSLLSMIAILQLITGSHEELDPFRQ